MSTPNPTKIPPEAVQPQEENLDKKPISGSWSDDMEQTLKLGDEMVTFLGGIVDLARMELLLAISSFPKVLMLWLLMMPVILLTWASFCVLTAWAVYAATGQLGWGIFMFFAQQLFLLLSCRWLFTKYRARMTLPYTRVQIKNFVRSVKDGFGEQGQTKE
jgi:uncharacterized membrane protein YqjE